MFVVVAGVGATDVVLGVVVVALSSVTGMAGIDAV